METSKQAKNVILHEIYVHFLYIFLRCVHIVVVLWFLRKFHFFFSFFFLFFGYSYDKFSSISEVIESSCE